MSKHNIKSVVELDEENEQARLDLEFNKQNKKETDEFFKEYEFNSKCINICADIREYLDKNALSDRLFKNLSVIHIKQFVSENY